MIEVRAKDGAGEESRAVAYAVDEEVLQAIMPGLLVNYQELETVKDASEVRFNEFSEVVKVFFESGSHAEAVAYIEEEDIYCGCTPDLVDLAEKDNMILTESVLYDEEKAEWLEPLWASLQEKIDAEKAKGKEFWLKEIKNAEKSD